MWTNLPHLDHLDHLGRGRCRGPSRACGAPRGAQMALAAPAPLPAAGAAPRSRVVITEELGDVLETPVGPGEVMLVRAVAGAGKSTMLELRARRNPSQQFLYLAYNDSVAKEMSQRFADLPNVTVLTLHALAYAHTPPQLTAEIADTITTAAAELVRFTRTSPADWPRDRQDDVLRIAASSRRRTRLCLQITQRKRWSRCVWCRGRRRCGGQSPLATTRSTTIAT